MQKLPEVDESKKNIRFAIIQTLVVTGFLLIVIFIASKIWINSTRDGEIAKIKSNLIQTVDIARNSIQPDIQRLKSGEISKKDALTEVEKKLRTMTYTDIYGENYIFLVDYSGTILVQPYQPELENTNQWQMKDDKGLLLIQAILADKEKGDKTGFVTYLYKPPNLDKPEEKLSYIVDIPELDCVIGTGKYMRLYYESQTEFINQATLITILLGVILLIVTLIPLQRISKTGDRLEKEIIARGETQLKLQESESNLRTVFDSISDALFIHDESGKIIEVNHRVLEMFECTREEIVGEFVRCIANPDDYHEPGLVAAWKRVLTGEDVTVELRAQKFHSKKPFYVEAAIQKGNWYGNDVILAVVRDISNRKFIERELVKNQILNEQAEEISDYGNFTIDLSKKQYKWSKGVYKIFQRDESLPAPDGAEYHDMIHPDDLEEVIHFEKAPREFNVVKKLEYRIIRADKEVRNILFCTTWLDENPPTIVGSIRDITDQIRSVSILREREEKFRTTIQQMTDALLILDENGSVIEWNPATEKLTGIPAKDAFGTEIWNILPKLQVNLYQSMSMGELAAEVISMIRTGQSRLLNAPQELTLVSIDGVRRTLLQKIFPINTPDKKRIGVISYDITEQKAAITKINREMNKLASLRSIDASILERASARETMELIAEITINQLDVDGVIISSIMGKDEICSVSRSNGNADLDAMLEAQKQLQQAMIQKFGLDKFTHETLSLIRQIEPQVTETGKNFHQHILPLFMNRKPCGFLQVWSQQPIPDDQGWKDYLITLAGQTSLAIENITLISNEEKAYQELLTAHEAIIAGWSKALELRDEETKGHSDRVMYLACHLAKMAGLPKEKMTSFRRGVLLHDIGKMGIPDRILLKPGPLTDDEWKIMKLHPGMAYDLLSTIPYLHDSLDVPYSHHERWDGSGYPRGLKGREIPLAARIFTIVDVWDALISDRPYRNGWEPEKIRQYLIDNKSIMFDPELVDKFLDLLDAKILGKEIDNDDECLI